MENSAGILYKQTIDILPNLSIRIPTIQEILQDEKSYYNAVSALTATPLQYMVQLDDMGFDYSEVTEFQLFKLLFPIYAKTDLSILFGNVDLSDFRLYVDEAGNDVLYSKSNDILIDELTYYSIADTLRKINLFEKVKGKPGNEHAKAYLLQKERKKQKRNAKKPYKPYLEPLVIALVNTSEFPYDFKSCMDLSIYQFNQSLKQINKKITFDNTMVGVYAGTIDTTKLSNKDCLSWFG